MFRSDCIGCFNFFSPSAAWPKKKAPPVAGRVGNKPNAASTWCGRYHRVDNTAISKRFQGEGGEHFCAIRNRNPALDIYRIVRRFVRPKEAVVRFVCILGIVLILSITSADAMDDPNRSCLDLLEEENDVALVVQDEQPLLTGNQCEAMKSRELRALLLEVPQEGEDPIQLSLGIKNGGGILRLKIPFSF
jgi:hypothetical protein